MGKKRKPDQFERGVLIALSTLHGLHDAPTDCADTLNDLLGEELLDCRDFTEYDRNNLKEIIENRESYQLDKKVLV